MSKSNKSIIIRNIILGIILLVLVVIITNNMSFATDYTDDGNPNTINDGLDALMTFGGIGDTFTLNLNIMIGSGTATNSKLYCIQYDASLKSNKKYTVKSAIGIKGDLVTIDGGSGESYELQSELTPRIAAILSAGGDDYGWGYGSAVGDYSYRQLALYANWNNWISDIMPEGGYSDYRNSEVQLTNTQSNKINELYEYAGDFSSANIINNELETKYTDDGMIGPFNVSYTGEISDIIAYDTVNNQMEGEILFYQKNDDESGYTKIDAIVSGENFYIKNNWSQTLGKINITVTKEYKPIRILILEAEEFDTQRLMCVYVAENIDDSTKSIDIEVSNNVSTTTLRVVKYGIGEDGYKDNAKKQTGVGFIIFKEGSGYLKYKNVTQIVEFGKMEYNTTDFEWIEDRNNATIFETVNTDDGWTGYFQIENIPTGTYHIGEVYNQNEGYEHGAIEICNIEKYVGEVTHEDSYVTDIQIKDNIDGYTENKMQVVKVVVDDATILRVYDNSNEVEKDFDINIYKIDSLSKDKIGGAEFKIKVYDGNQEKGWLYYNIKEEKYYYEDIEYSDSTTWNTGTGTSKNSIVYANKTGELELKGLSAKYDYKIYEFNPADGYLKLIAQAASNKMEVDIEDTTTKITTANNYIAATDDIPHSIYCGTVSYDDNGSIAEIEVTNIKSNGGGNGGSSNYVDISGFVWIDKPLTKNSDEYDNLYNDGDNVDDLLEDKKAVVKLMKKSTNSVVTIGGKKVEKELTNGTFEFLGKDTKITSSKLSNYYIEVYYKEIGEKYNIIEYSDKNNGSKAIYQSAGVAGTEAIDKSNHLYMNIGLREISTDVPQVTKWVKEVTVKMDINGTEHYYTYEYGKDNTMVGGGANVGIGNSTYYRTIYASDIVYWKGLGVTDTLEVYITYCINVSKQFKYVKKSIDEDKITVKLQDKYNENYYELSDDKWSGGNGKATYEFELEDKNRRTETIDKTIDITFKLTYDALKEVLEKGSFTTGNKVDVSGVLTYEKYGITGYDKDLDPIYGWPDESYTKGYKCNPAYAPGMKFSIYEYGTETVAQRTISGTVFKDKNIKDNGEIIGDGKYKATEENVIQNVKVELLENDQKTIATLYRHKTNKDIDPENGNEELYINPITKKYEIYDADISEEGVQNNAEYKTGNNGYYKFSGIIPR